MQGSGSLLVIGCLLAACSSAAPVSRHRSTKASPPAMIPIPASHEPPAPPDPTDTDGPPSDIYFSDERARYYETQLLEAELNHAPTLLLHLAAAKETLASGDCAAALAHLTSAQSEIDAHNAPPFLSLQLDVWRLMAEAWMRVAEQRNCVMHHGSGSCLLPISPDAYHVDESGSRNALSYLAHILAVTPHDYEARWLYNICAMTIGEWPGAVPLDQLIPPSAFESEAIADRFRDAAAACGLSARTLGGGACLDDFDGDGDLDIVTSQCSIAGTMHYYANAGDGVFVDRTADARIGSLTGGSNLVHADVDNDGDNDVLVLRGAWRSGYW